MPSYSHGSHTRKIKLRAELRASFKTINMTSNIPTKPPHLPKSLIFLGRPPQDHLTPLKIKTIEQPIPYPETRKPSKHLNIPLLTSIPESPILTIEKYKILPSRLNNTHIHRSPHLPFKPPKTSFLQGLSRNDQKAPTPKSHSTSSAPSLLHHRALCTLSTSTSSPILLISSPTGEMHTYTM